MFLEFKTNFMRIVFGHNSFVIKRLSSRELGISAEEQVYEVQLRQKYAHLYFIPVFPIGQVWVAKKTNGNLYDVPERIKHTLKTQYPSRVHLGAFALPILVILGFLIYYISEEVKHHQWENDRVESLLATGTDMKKSVDTLQNPNTFFLFSDNNNDDSVINSDIFYKVLKTNKTDILLGKLEKASSFSDTIKTKYSFPNNVNTYIHYKESKIVDSVWIKKKLLKDAIKTKDSFELVTIKGVSDKKIRLSNILNINDAYFERHISSADTEFYKEYINYGLDVVLDSIVPTKKGEVWKLSKQKTIQFGEKFAVKTESDNEATLYYHLLGTNKKRNTTVTRNSIDSSIIMEY